MPLQVVFVTSISSVSLIYSFLALLKC